MCARHDLNWASPECFSHFSFENLNVFLFLHYSFILLPLHILIKKRIKGGFGIKDMFWQMWQLLCCYKIRGCHHKEMQSICIFFSLTTIHLDIWHRYYYQYQGLKVFQYISSGFKCALSEALFMKLINRSSRSTRSLASHEVQRVMHIQKLFQKKLKHI